MQYLKKHLPLLLILSLGFSALAQPGQRRMQDERMRAIESRRIAYFTEKMALTPSEATVFWPIYNEYLRKLEALNEQHRAWSREMASRDMISEAEATVFAEREVQRFEETASLKRTYHEKLKAVIPATKILQLYEAEKSFNRLLFRESQHRMRDRRDQ
jgi:hypothetical protein